MTFYRVKPGHGYWDTTHFGIGGSFKRATDSTPGGTIIREFSNPRPWVELQLTDGSKAATERIHIMEVG